MVKGKGRGKEREKGEDDKRGHRGKRARLERGKDEKGKGRRGESGEGCFEVDKGRGKVDEDGV